jgi:integral membrane protein (TIGR01906 family)
MKRLLALFLIISLSITFLMIAIESNAYNINYYLKAFKKHNIEDITGKNMSQLEEIANSLIEYLKGNGYDELLTPYFNDKEVAHMKDVQDLFDKARLIKFIGLFTSFILIVLLVNKIGAKKMGKVLFLGLFANHVIILLLTLIISTNFNKYWTIFHHIFFTNDLWLLNPETDLMIQMLPEPFFSGIAINIVLSFFLYLSIIQLVGLYFMKRGRDKWKGLKN